MAIIARPIPETPLTNGGLKLFLQHLAVYVKDDDKPCSGTVTADPSGRSLIDADFDCTIGHEKWHLRLELQPNQ